MVIDIFRWPNYYKIHILYSLPPCLTPTANMPGPPPFACERVLPLVLVKVTNFYLLQYLREQKTSLDETDLQEFIWTLKEQHNNSPWNITLCLDWWRFNPTANSSMCASIRGYTFGLLFSDCSQIYFKMETVRTHTNENPTLKWVFLTKLAIEKDQYRNEGISLENTWFLDSTHILKYFRHFVPILSWLWSIVLGQFRSTFSCPHGKSFCAPYNSPVLAIFGTSKTPAHIHSVKTECRYTLTSPRKAYICFLGSKQYHFLVVFWSIMYFYLDLVVFLLITAGHTNGQCFDKSLTRVKMRQRKSLVNAKMAANLYLLFLLLVHSNNHSFCLYDTSGSKITFNILRVSQNIHFGLKKVIWPYLSDKHNWCIISFCMKRLTILSFHS